VVNNPDSVFACVEACELLVLVEVTFASVGATSAQVKADAREQAVNNKVVLVINLVMMKSSKNVRVLTNFGTHNRQIFAAVSQLTFEDWIYSQKSEYFSRKLQLG